MTVTIWEKHLTRSGRSSPEDPSIDVIYGVKGTNDEQIVDQLVADTVDTTWPTVGPLGPGTGTPLTLQGWRREFKGGYLWDVTVSYARKDPRAPGSVQISFDFTGSNQHLTQSRGTLNSAGNVSIFNRNTDITGAPDYNGAIGVTDTGIEGVDVLYPKTELTMLIVAEAAVLDDDFFQQIQAAAGTINDDPWFVTYQGQTLEFQPGEVLFQGGPCNFRGDGCWEMNFKFAVSRDVQGPIVLGGVYDVNGNPIGGISLYATDDGPAKPGWAYLWTRYQTQMVNGYPVKVPLAAYVEQLYATTNFTNLFSPIGGWASETWPPVSAN